MTWRWTGINCGLNMDLLFSQHTTNVSSQNINLFLQSTLWPQNRYGVCTKHQETATECQ